MKYNVRVETAISKKTGTHYEYIGLYYGEILVKKIFLTNLEKELINTIESIENSKK